MPENVKRIAIYGHMATITTPVCFATLNCHCTIIIAIFISYGHKTKVLKVASL